MKHKGFFFAIIVVLVAAGFSLVSAQMKSFSITSGPEGGDWFAIGRIMGEMAKPLFPEAEVKVAPGNALANLAKVEEGTADVGLSMAKLYGEAIEGTGLYAGQPGMDNLLAVAMLAPIPLGLVLARADSPMVSLGDIKEKGLPVRVLTSKKGSSPAVAAELLLQEYGITNQEIEDNGGSISYVSFAEAANLLKSGQADVWIGPMVSSIVELTSFRKMKLLPVSEEVLQRLIDQHKYVRVTWPKGKYPFVTKPTPLLAEAVIVVCQTGLSPEAMYAFTRALSENAARIRAVDPLYNQFDPKTAWQNVGGPLHPGAEKFYREMGYLK